VPVVNDEGQVILAKDEYPRSQTTAEDLGALKPSFAQIADMAADRHGTTFRIIDPALQLRVEQADHVERQRVKRFFRIELREAEPLPAGRVLLTEQDLCGTSGSVSHLALLRASTPQERPAPRPCHARRTVLA
jgi:hypothetical protein